MILRDLKIMKSFFDGMDEFSSEYESFVGSMEKVRTDFPSLWALVGKANAMSKLLMHVSSGSSVVTAHESGQSLIGIWNRIRMYQNTSFILLAANQINEGLAVLRMAAETTFVLKACCVSSRNLLLFVEHGVPKDKDFKEAGKMDLENSTEKAIFELYNFCSRYGVHGHITSEFYSEPDAPDYGASKYLRIWFSYYVAPHRFAFEHLWKDSQFDGIEQWREEIFSVNTDLIMATFEEGFFR